MTINIFKNILNWIAKVMVMERETFSGLTFHHLLEFTKNPNCVVKYNWVASVNEIFFMPENEMHKWEKQELFLSQDNREDLIDLI